MQRNNSSGSESSITRLKNLVPFYAVPASRKTSAEIISEARAAVGLQPSEMNPSAPVAGGARIGMKPVSTKRPFTPREKQRTLFGPSKSSRPSSSALSLSLHVEEEEEAELQQASGSCSPPWGGVRLPSLPPETNTNSRASAKLQRTQFRAASLSKLVEERDKSEGAAPLGVVGTAVLRRSSKEAIQAVAAAAVSPQQQPLCAAALAKSLAEPKGRTQVKPPQVGAASRAPQQQDSKAAATRFSVASAHGTDRKLIRHDKGVSNVESRGKVVNAKPIDVSLKSPTAVPAPETISYDEVLSLINVLKILAQQGGSAEEVETTLRKLYGACDRAQMLGRSRSSSQHAAVTARSYLLRTLFLLVEREEQRVTLQLARILLALQVLGPNLGAVCKLVFKVSRCDQNDQLFLEDNILELLLERLGGASLVEDAEACVYGYGALKFVTMEPRVVSRVLQLGGLDLMVLHMKLINLMAQESGGRVPEQALQALFQLTGALRHVAGESSALSAFVSSGALAQLCRALQLFASDPDLMSNVARTLSIASTHEGCCDALVAQQGCLHACVALLEKFPRRQDLVVRLSYALGNVMARSEHARRQLLGEEGSRASVLAILGRCWAEDQAAPGSPDESREHTPDQNSAVASMHATEDVLVKVLRVVANASLSESVGPALADCSELLTAVRGVLAAKHAAHSEELVLGALLTLNNLSFYPSAEHSRLADQQIDFARALMPLLTTGHSTEATVETLRVFGNLTRWKETRDFLAERNVGSRVLELLSEGDSELQYVAAGVLVNLLADPEARAALRKSGTMLKLTQLLQQQSERGQAADWELAGLTCQALWNCCADLQRIDHVLGAHDAETLVTLLADLLDDERLFGVAEGVVVSEAVAATQPYQMWEEFASVATNLLERLEGLLETQHAAEELAPTRPAALSPPEPA